MNKQRLDIMMVERGILPSRSQAENYIRLGKVQVDGKTNLNPQFYVSVDSQIGFNNENNFVGRGGLKLAGAAEAFAISFKNKSVLDVGSSTGGFTDYALKNGARKVIAVDVGSGQMHASLRNDPRIELHEKTDIRDLRLRSLVDIAMIDVSFISIKKILPAVLKLVNKKGYIVAMIKPQFEAEPSLVNKGVIKNSAIRRQILKDFEAWAKEDFQIMAKADSQIPGTKGNQERFYLLAKRLT
jgi:23S rRNA (cytidine1920-2'-O)/16S rRNA (cytidine1409-2'-O)-methyltransferase